MRLLDSSFSWNDQKRCVALKNHIDVLWAKGNHSPVVQDYVREERVRLLVAVFNRFLIEL